MGSVTLPILESSSTYMNLSVYTLSPGSMIFAHYGMLSMITLNVVEVRSIAQLHVMTCIIKSFNRMILHKSIGQEFVLRVIPVVVINE